jgi:hypothetical protein
LKFWIALLAGAAMLPAQTPEVELRLGTAGGQTTFHLGERIPIELSFTSSVPGKHTLFGSSPDRFGFEARDETYEVTPADGAADPLADYYKGGFIGHGPIWQKQLSTTPVVVARDLNQWVRFDRAGRYRVRAISHRVRDVEVRSNEIEVELVNDPAWRAAQLADAEHVLRTTPQGGDSSVYEKWTAAAHQLWYLDTPESIRESARLLDGSAVQVEQLVRLGLLASGHRQLAIETMRQLLGDPAYSVSRMFLETFAQLESLNPADLRPQLEKVLERKQGAAKATSRNTWIQTADTVDAVPPSMRTAIANEFFDLSERDQTAVLQWEWSRVASPAMLPVLRKICDSMKAARPSEPSLSAAAMERLYELDPAEGRRRILAEMALPAPRLPFSTLSLLPDETLPDLDAQWIANLGNRNAARQEIEELIARYGSKSIEGQVKTFYQALDVEALTREGTVGDPPRSIATPACEPPLYAYFLRVDPPYGEKLLRQVMADRDYEFGRCWMKAIGETAHYYTNAQWERVAADALNDSTVMVKMDAVKALGQYGSPGSAAQIFDAFQYFHNWWKDKPSQLNEENRRLEWTFVQTIDGSSNWIPGDGDLAHAMALCITDACRRQMEQMRAYWTRPLVVSAGRSSDGSYSVWLMQYNERSLEAGRRRLLQIPAGTHIQLQSQGWPDETLNKWMDRMQRELENRGVTVVR